MVVYVNTNCIDSTSFFLYDIVCYLSIRYTYTTSCKHPQQCVYLAEHKHTALHAREIGYIMYKIFTGSTVRYAMYYGTKMLVVSNYCILCWF